MPKNNAQEDEKTFSLKQIEQRVIGNINERHNAEILDMLSFIAVERLAYNVTALTQFRIDETGNLYIKEMPEPQPIEGEVIPPTDDEVAVA